MAWEHRKLISGLELEVREMKEPKYLALVNGERGTSKEDSCGGTPKNGAQGGQPQVEYELAVSDCETGREA